MVRKAKTRPGSGEKPQDVFDKEQSEANSQEYFKVMKEKTLRRSSRKLQDKEHPDADSQDNSKEKNDSVGRTECDDQNENNKQTETDPLSNLATELNKASQPSSSETDPLSTFNAKQVLVDTSQNDKTASTTDPPGKPDDINPDKENETNILPENSGPGLSDNPGSVNINNGLTNLYSGLSPKQIRTTMHK